MKKVHKILSEKIIQEELQQILGQKDSKNQLKGAILAGHNILIIGPPGVGKTTIAKNLANLLPEKNFVRVQGSPDLTVEDLLGDIDPIKALEFGPTSKKAFTPGKIFKANNGILFFDEINRAPEKLQNALLQVLQEGYATLGSYDVDFDTNFLFIATMNPTDINTEKLSNVFLDRFDVVFMTHPETINIEQQIVINKGLKQAEFPEDLLRKVIEFIRKLREDKDVEKPPSVRASISLYERAQTHAKLKGKNKVNMSDIQAVLLSVLSHRVELKAGLKYLTTPKSFIEEKFAKHTETDTSKTGDLP